MCLVIMMIIMVRLYISRKVLVILIERMMMPVGQATCPLSLVSEVLCFAKEMVVIIMDHYHWILRMMI